MRTTLNKRGGSMSSSLHVVASFASVASTETGAGNGIVLTPSPEIVACTRRRPFRRIGTMAANGDHPLLPRHKQTTPTPSRPDRPRGPAPACGPSTSRPAEWCTLRRRHRLPSRPDRPRGSTTGNGCWSTSPPAGGSPRRRLRARTTICHGRNSCSHAPAPEVADWID